MRSEGGRRGPGSGPGLATDENVIPQEYVMHNTYEK